MRLLASVLALAVACVYLGLIGREGEGFDGRTWLVYGSLVAGALLVLAPRLLPAAAGAALLVAWTLLGAASIGWLVLPSAVLACVAARRRAAAVAPDQALLGSLAGAAIGIGAVAAGLWLT